jgi:Fungalysin metallopeptidase (M36)/Ig-like domain CHU_C associated/Secretion system C-terminal sorting domain
MRNFYPQFLLTLFFSFLTAFTALQAQNAKQKFDAVAAMKLVADNKAALQLTDEEISNSEVIYAYHNKFTDCELVYLQQHFKGLPIYNVVQTLAFKNNVLVSKAGNRIKYLNKFHGSTSKLPSVAASEALVAAAISKKLFVNQTPKAIANTTTNPNKVTFSNLGIAKEDITAELMWIPVEGSKEFVKLAWQIYLVQKTSSDYWVINIDAQTNRVISEQNLTVYCNFDDKKDNCNILKHEHNNINKASAARSTKTQPSAFVQNLKKSLRLNSPRIVNGATYRVVAFPAESPIHASATSSVVSNPWNLSGAGNLATTNKWHSVGAIDYNYTRGNNVWAQEDRNGNNGTAPTQVTSITPGTDPLNFEFVPDYTVDPTQTAPVPNQQFNTVNLFYWNNIIHDLTYQYGFDEAARNFQAENFGRGGVAGDFVFADAQDGAGTNNANFSTPADGGNGRMQMFLWTAPNPDRDGDVDNGIIVHEYGHGISNRLTGTGSGCLGSAEQMGEGWSDYYCLMYTQDWANSTLTTGFDVPRGIGTYAANQATTGPGIRTQRYSTNFAINNRSYATTISTSQHTRGEIWCATLWDMTWNIINQIGSINNNLFNANGVGGNSIALKLVTEGMKLQPCNPGFIDGRNAILQADQILYNGAYRCSILEAFRRRGMGIGASQGSAGSVTDQTPSFTNAGATIRLVHAGATSVAEGQNVTYINRVTTEACGATTGFIITDTLPTNVTYVSGGSYNAATRVVSFPINQAAGSTVDYLFTVTINNGTYFAPVTILNETVPATIPASFTAVTTVPAGGNLFNVSTAAASSAPNAFFCSNDVISTDKRLETTNTIAIPAGASALTRLSFAHRYNTEADWDGGVVEASADNGGTWTDLGNSFLINKYNGALGAGAGNNLSGRSAFTGLQNTFITSVARLSNFNGQNIKLRFRFGSDDNTAGVAGSPSGWFIDDILINSVAAVSMRGNVINATGVRTSFADTITLILPGVVTGPSITASPTNVSTCAGTTATFTATALNATSLRWQVSTNGGGAWADVIPAATTNTLVLTNVTLAMNNNQYRMVATSGLGSVNSNPATLTVTAATAPPVVTNATVTYCQNATAVALSATGTGLLWYTQASGGTGNSTAIVPSTATAGTTTYYVSQTNATCGESIRVPITVTVNGTPAAPSTTAANVSYCQNTVSSVLSANGSNLLWYTQASGGVGDPAAPLPATDVIGTFNFYVSQTISGCEGPRTLITVNITAPPSITTQPQSVTVCATTATFSVTATGTALTYQWFVSTDGGTNFSAIPAATNATYTVTGLTSAQANNRYRVVVSSGNCAPAVSNSVTAKVGEKPVVVLTAAPSANINPSINGILFTTVSPLGNYVYSWTLNNANISFAGTSLNNNNGLLNGFGAYQVRVTDTITGCFGLSNLVTTSDIEAQRNDLFISPNPTRGIVRVSFYNGTGTNQVRNIVVYDEKGARIINQQVTFAAGVYSSVSIDLTNVATGNYMLALLNSEGKQIKTKIIVKN